MGYKIKDWRRRIAERSDMSSSVIHLTREAGETIIQKILYKILSEKKIIGSTTDSGFICGYTKAVCFQDAPLTSICQNVFFEQKQREQNNQYKIRYRAFGLMFEKSYAFAKGARPVIYEKASQAKEFLPKNQWWRIVNLNLEDKENIIDWTHEREWRCPGDFEFDLTEVTLIAIRQETVAYLCQEFNKNFKIDLLSKIKGIVTMEHVLY